MQYRIFLIAISLSSASLLAACGGGGVPLTAEERCSCSGYSLQTTRPAWVGADAVAQGNYRTSGVAQCSSLQEIDLKKADLSARSNLGRMISSQVSSEILSTSHDGGYGAGASGGKSRSFVASDALLENSQIYDRWLDINNCAIHSAVKISTADIERSLKKLASIENNKFKNQRFFVEAKGAHVKILNQGITSVLSNLGVRQIVAQPQKNYFRIVASLADSVMVTDNAGSVASKGQLSVRIYDMNNVNVWSWASPIKGVSFSNRSKIDLDRIAIRNGMRILESDLKEKLEQPIGKRRG